MHFRTSLLSFSTILLLISGSTAQVTTGSAILGAVRDQTGAVVTGVEITVTDLGTGSRRVATTGNDGTYVFENLKPGSYQVSATKTGFKEKTTSGIVLQVSQRARIDVDMEVGVISERIQVEATAPIIESENSSVGEVITTQQIVDLPLNGRQFLQLATLTPGVVKGTVSFHETTGGSIIVNGLSVFSNNTMVDGIMNQETGAGRMTFSPSVDLIQEFKIQSNTYDAEYGRTGGAQIEVVTKRGDNVYHGSAFEFLRNNALDARPLFQVGELPPFRRNQFGATLGGRIPFLKKDFFFFSYEGLRSSRGLTAVMSLPPAAIRGGDFSSVSTIIFDPQTQDPVTGQRQPFPGNVIPANRISPVTTYFLNRFVPVPNSGSGLVNNFVTNPDQIENINQISIRYDRDFSEADSLTLRYTRNRYDAILPRGDSGVAMPVAGLGEDVNLYSHNSKIGWTHVFSPTMLNSLNLGFSQYFQDRFPESAFQGTIAESGMQGVRETETGIPTFNIAGFQSITDNFVSPIRQPFNNFIVSDTASKIVGSHSLRFGGSFVYHRSQAENNLFTRGTLNFGPLYTTSAVSAPGNQFNAFAEFLLGLPNSTSIRLNALRGDWRSHSTSGFLQDNWTVSPSLTLNLGIRYDVYVRPFDTQNRMVALDLETLRNVYSTSIPTLPGTFPNSLVAQDVGYPRNLQFPTTYNNWSPRAGFAWKLFGSNNAVLRGGYGLFYHWLTTNSISNLSQGPPWVPTVGITCNPSAPCVTADNPFSSNVVPSLSGVVASKKNRTPYVHQVSLGVQHAFGPTMSLDVGYVGNVGRNNLVRWNINQAAPGPGPVAPRQPFPTLSTLIAYETIGRSHYDSLQATFRKTYDSRGLVFLASYTWGHALGDSISGPEPAEFIPVPIRDFRNLDAEYGNLPTDVRQILSLSWIYELPFGRGKPIGRGLEGFANALIGGWKVDGIGTLRSGNYLTPTDIVNVSNAGNSRPDVIGDPNGRSHSSTADALQQWFNTSAFQRAPQFTFGNAGMGIIEGPGFVSFDLALHKRFAIKETMGLQFRSEFFNAFNHSNLANPNTTFGSPSFGTISGITGTARSIQFGLRFDF